jgi:hypothetical protein
MSAAEPVFSLNDPRQYFARVVEENFAELEANPDVHRVLNCTVTTCHMADWVFRHWFDDHENQMHRRRWLELGISDTYPGEGERFRLFLGWLEREPQCPKAQWVRDVTNHSKHIKNTVGTNEGLALSAMGAVTLTFGHEWVWSVIKGDPETNATGVLLYKQHQPGSALWDTIDFWRKFLKEHEHWS